MGLARRLFLVMSIAILSFGHVRAAPAETVLDVDVETTVSTNHITGGIALRFQAVG